MAATERRVIARHVTKVIHRHRVGTHAFSRVSELVFVAGRPRAVLEWLDLGGVRTPVYLAELDPKKLRASPHLRRVYFYDGVTSDPRFDLLQTNHEMLRK
jgi:hypothetical protein